MLLQYPIMRSLQSLHAVDCHWQLWLGACG
jgi:hypothetical protein